MEDARLKALTDVTLVGAAVDLVLGVLKVFLGVVDFLGTTFRRCETFQEKPAAFLFQFFYARIYACFRQVFQLSIIF